MGYQECWVIPKNQDDFESLLCTYAELYRAGYYEILSPNFACPASPFGAVVLKKTIIANETISILSGTKLLWTFGERFAQTPRILFKNTYFSNSDTLDIISIENIICSNEEYNIFSALDFRKNSENNFLKFYYIETIENNTIDNILTEILSK